MAEALERVAVQIEQGRTRDRQAGLYLAGVQAFEEGRWDLAVERLREVTAIDPEYEDAADLLVAAQQAQVQTKTEARQQLERVQQRRKSLLQSQLAVPPAPAAPPSPALAPGENAAPETPPPLAPAPAPEGEDAPPPTSVADEATPPVARKDLRPAAQPNQGDGSAPARPVIAPRAAGQRNFIGLAAIGLAVLGA